ncbi:hypothetical protein [Paenibacillus sp. LHD-38]|uniref:hypothetical protein n=1 Tax=Paenibacillus sp. LHD-38 TaxID=3072143 RepID=UPI00280EC09E|nr:hypothetical protein [Paenibacillus sp. LHD-38]MDQ8735015.1 hypothetical protein [Paenibacillus sp. LHD-38]
MNVFLLNPDHHGLRHIPMFLKDNYVGFSWPGIADLEDVSQADWHNKAVQAYKDEGQVLLERLAEIGCFVYGMQDGDYLFATDGEYVHLGDLGDYYYVESSETDEDSLSHRRGVTWLKSMLKADVQPELKSFLNRQVKIAKLEQSVTQEQMEYWMTNAVKQEQGAVQSVLVDEETIARALDILNEAMSSGDTERRERAAIAILQFAKT